MTPLASARILLIVGGGIAAYKAPDLVRRLRERGAHVRVVMTAAAEHFITPLTLASVSGDTVYRDLWSLTDEAQMGHIELSRAADLIVVAPATADLMAKFAHGLADDLASTLLLATDKRVLMAPAMNLRMWLAAPTQRNLATLRGDGTLFVGPDDGAMACGEYGPGRMSEPLAIVDAVEAALQSDTRLPLETGTDVIFVRTDGAPEPRPPLLGRRVLVTSGPTYEPLDPVRFIANRSSGKQGHAIAAAAATAGAHVTLVSGPVAIADPPGVTVVHVETARQMLDAVEDALPADLFVAAAAVADWRPAEVSVGKRKKGATDVSALPLVENPDILATITRRRGDRPALVVGFAAETDTVLDFARAKLARKGCDMIVANDVGAKGGVMGGDTNTVHLVTSNGVETWPTLAKDEVARRLVERFATLLAGEPA